MQNAPASYSLMRDALYKAGRPVVFSICEWGLNQPWLWADTVGHLYRTTADIKANFLIHNPKWSQTVVGIIDKVNNLRKYNGPDHWNDLDMLEVGNQGLSIPESRCHFSMWCMLSAPLMTGNDLRNMTDEIVRILTNKEVIALDQDPAGIPALKWIDYGNHEVWLKPLSNGDYALAFLNIDKKPWAYEIDLNDNRIYDGDFNNIRDGIYEIDESFRIRDLWNHKEIGSTAKPLKITVPGHDLILVRLIKQ
jgi:alpha-galactosidase